MLYYSVCAWWRVDAALMNILELRITTWLMVAALIETSLLSLKATKYLAACNTYFTILVSDISRKHLTKSEDRATINEAIAAEFFKMQGF